MIGSVKGSMCEDGIEDRDSGASLCENGITGGLEDLEVNERGRSARKDARA